jgi:type VI secretion system secreted protein VgrG
MTKNRGHSKKAYALASFVTMALLSPAAFLISSSSAANPVIRQGSTSTYGVLAASTVTNTGTTSITGTAGGDIGLSPGTSFTGAASVTRSGVDHIADAAAATAQVDLVVAYNDLSIPTSTVLATSDLSGQSLIPGSYSTASGTLANSGVLTFDAKGDSTAIFILRAASTVTTSPSSSMVLTGGAQACNVYWQVGSSATIGVTSIFVGHIYALASITANTGSTIYGQLLARTGAVTLDSNRIINDACTTPVPVVTATPVPVVTATPVPVVTATPVPVVTATPVPVVTATPAIVYDALAPRVSSTLCIATDEYRAILIGNFPNQVTVISVNGVHLASSHWEQSDHRIAVAIPAGIPANFSVELLINDVAIVPTQYFECGELTPLSVVETSPEPITTQAPVVGIDVETPTVTGGTLPNTAGNAYTVLLAGLVAMGLGLVGISFRKKAQRS